LAGTLLLAGWLLTVILSDETTSPLAAPTNPTVSRPSAQPTPPTLRDDRPESPDALPPERVPVARLEVPVLHSAESGSISGVVESKSGVPIPGARCFLAADYAPVGLGAIVYRSQDAAPVETGTVTDESGAFRLVAKAGHWRLRVEAEGFGSWEEGHLVQGDFRRVRLGAARRLRVDVAESHGYAVAGAEVSLKRGRFSDPRGRAQLRTSDEVGAASFEDVPSGPWFVHVRHPVFAATIAPVPNSEGGTSQLRIVLGEGRRIEGVVTVAGGARPPQPARVQFDADDGGLTSHHLTTDRDGRFVSQYAFPAEGMIEVAAIAAGYGEIRRTVSLSELGENGRIRVDLELETTECKATAIVRNVDGEPLRGVEVYAVPLQSLPEAALIRIPSEQELARDGSPNLDAYEPVESNVSRFRLAGRSDGLGRFEVTGLKARTPYKLMLVSESHSNRVLWFEEAEAGVTTDFGSVVLLEGGRIWGNVIRPDGRPIEGEVVYLVNLKRHNLIPDSEFQTARPVAQVGRVQAVSNADGFFSIDPVPESTFMLMCLGTMFGPYSVIEGETLGPLELITPDKHRKSAARTRSVTVTVTGESGVPIRGAFVSFDRILEQSDALGLNDDYYLVVEPDGRAQLEMLPGQYTGIAMDMTGRHGEQTLSVAIPETETGSFVEFYLPKSLTPPDALEGRVEDEFYRPIPGMEVSLIPVTGDLSCNCMQLKRLTDEDGRFSFGPFLPGNHRIIVTDPARLRAVAHHYPARPGDPIGIRMP
jgi:hypothetical protein